MNTTFYQNYSSINGISNTFSNNINNIDLITTNSLIINGVAITNNKELRAIGVTDPTILGSNTKNIKINATNKTKIDHIVAKYHILGGFKNTNGNQ